MISPSTSHGHLASLPAHHSVEALIESLDRILSARPFCTRADIESLSDKIREIMPNDQQREFLAQGLVPDERNVIDIWRRISDLENGLPFFSPAIDALLVNASKISKIGSRIGGVRDRIKMIMPLADEELSQLSASLKPDPTTKKTTFLKTLASIEKARAAKEASADLSTPIRLPSRDSNPTLPAKLRRLPAEEATPAPIRPASIIPPASPPKVERTAPAPVAAPVNAPRPEAAVQSKPTPETPAAAPVIKNNLASPAQLNGTNLTPVKPRLYIDLDFNQSDKTLSLQLISKDGPKINEGERKPLYLVGGNAVADLNTQVTLQGPLGGPVQVDLKLELIDSKPWLRPGASRQERTYIHKLTATFGDVKREIYLWAYDHLSGTFASECTNPMMLLEK